MTDGHSSTPGFSTTLTDVTLVRPKQELGCRARARQPPSSKVGHLESFCAQGAATGGACAGSVSFVLDGGARRAQPEAQTLFARFVAEQVPTPMCR